jgi:hypothetical protein
MYFVTVTYGRFTELLHNYRAWTTLEEDYIAFLLPAPKCKVLMLELSKKNT